MLHPTIEELTQGKYNRYELALATAKCARIITDEYVRQHDAAERAQTGNKETDRPINTLIDRELRDEKAVKVAIGRLHAGEYQIDENALILAKEKAEAEELAATIGYIGGTLLTEDEEAEVFADEVEDEESDADSEDADSYDDTDE